MKGKEEGGEGRKKGEGEGQLLYFFEFVFDLGQDY